MKKAEEKEVTFEKQIKLLEQIVSELEKGDLNLEESVSKFEEGMKISKTCNDMLEKAEKKITILLNQNGEMVEEKFDVEENN